MQPQSFYTIGLMSGSSIDGLDICFSKFILNNKQWSFEILEAETIIYNEIWKNKLLNATHQDAIGLQLLDLEFGIFLGESVNKFIKNKKINSSLIDLISSHGHTVFHQPQKGISLQIGCGAAILNITQKTVVCDFRKQDVVFGGQGAPLVPIGDKLLFPEFGSCLNLGGFSNISFQKNNQTIAFDICPVNNVLNKLAQQFFNKDFDENGNIAKDGEVIPELLTELNLLSFYRLKSPKSLGIEWVESQIEPILDRFENKKNVITTFTQHIAYQISQVLITHELKNPLVTGGGAKNDFLFKKIQEKVGFNILLPSLTLIDFKEALIFSFLGLLKYRNEVNVLSSVTGAKKDHSSGIIYLA